MIRIYKANKNDNYIILFVIHCKVFRMWKKI